MSVRAVQPAESRLAEAGVIIAVHALLRRRFGYYAFADIGVGLLTREFDSVFVVTIGSLSTLFKGSLAAPAPPSRPGSHNNKTRNDAEDGGDMVQS